jgi:hypothetical protein
MALKIMDNITCSCGHRAFYKEFMPHDVLMQKARCPVCRGTDLIDFYGLPVNNDMNYPKPKRKYNDPKRHQ